ncbi:class I glutamine amidotransferase-like protein [Punctularia strigosozonata HHB-11173 SS5]|uniref:class I glutamine amidotransferase-like protein n=1 Tax=Punctularia strigosozonata (strain HHB-11173) TaxID=741275 RepID=UPI000441781B|nr:class I glutamine amidotransferase-like protein [Punctularia strigosozonata HHB-11173 SS5]EIN09780.1 class I glutamine amidotransferase-like protein [Punctularia strigosozonata HHB-11173 SS5]
MVSTYIIRHSSLVVAFLCLATLVSANPRVLIYSATADFRHDSIPTAVQALQNTSESTNTLFDHTEDKTLFTDDNLANYDALLFLMNTGEVLDQQGKDALQKYLDKGGNFVAIHAASDALRNTTFYGHEVGAFFDYHPELQNGTIDVIGPSHPSTSMLPAQWHVQEEFYNFKSDPRDVGAIVILSANDSSYTDTGTRMNQGAPHPTAWYQEHGAGVESGGTAGRSFYTSLGHLNATWHDELFMGHVTGGIAWALQANTTRAFNASAAVGNAAATSSSSATPGSGSSSAVSTAGSSAQPTSS